MTTLILAILADGRALTAAEIARTGGVSVDAVTGQLESLLSLSVVERVQQGPHRYYRLVKREAAVGIAHKGQSALAHAARTGPLDPVLRHARTCYGHLAGELGVALSDHMVGQGYISFTQDRGILNDSGLVFLRELGLHDKALRQAQSQDGRAFCRPCLDWSERRPHMGGTVGKALCQCLLVSGWLSQVPGSRALTPTPEGRRRFQRLLGRL